jgi:DNA-binding NarL/FixJ family response regulator
VLGEEPRIEIVGEAAKNFGEAIIKAEELKPKVVLMDVHMGDESAFPTDIVKARLLDSTECILATSLWNDEETTKSATVRLCC